MDGSPDPEDPAGTVPPGSDPALPVRASLLKHAPDGSLLHLRVHVTDSIGIGPLFSEAGWDVVRAGPLSICLKLDA